MSVDVQDVLLDVRVRCGRSGDLFREAIPGHRRLDLHGRDRQERGKGMASCGVAGGVGGDEGEHTLGLSTQYLLRDVAAQAETDQHDPPDG